MTRTNGVVVYLLLLVDALFDTASPGPMMVYALTLNITTVLGGRSLNVCCVADVLV